MKIKAIVIILTIQLVLITLFSCIIFETVSASPIWYDDDWLHCKKIIIDHTKVSATLTNFPMLFDNTSSDFITAQADGDDFKFIASGNVSVYNHETVSFVGNRYIAWVNITSISHAVDTVLWLYYGNSGCSNQENVLGTWNSNYKLVQHMNDSTTSSVSDSSISNYDGTKKGVNNPIEIDGKIGKAQDFDGSDDYITMGNVLAYERTDSFTISCWAKFDSKTIGSLLGKYYNKGYYQLLDAGKLNIIFYSASTKKIDVITSSIIGTGTWNYITLSYGGTSKANCVRIYVNGTSRALTVNADTLSATIIGTEPLTSGANYDGGATKRYFTDGIIDECRIMNINISSSWVLTEYNNQNSPSTFLSVGVEVDVSVIPTSPSTFNCYTLANNTIYLNWTKGTYSSSTIILVNNVWYPTLSDNIIYNGSREYFYYTSTNINKNYFFLAYSYNVTYNTTSISPYVYCHETTFGYGLLYHYENIDNATGTHVHTLPSIRGNYSIWANYTGNTTPLNKYENIINATGYHNHTLNSTGYHVYANYTGTGGVPFDPNSTDVWLYLGAMLTLDNGQFFLLILIGLWSYFIYLYYKEKEVIFSFCIICCGLPLGIILSGVAYYNSYPFGYLISFILILISFLIPTYGMYQKNKKKK